MLIKGGGGDRRISNLAYLCLMTVIGASNTLTVPSDSNDDVVNSKETESKFKPNAADYV